MDFIKQSRRNFLSIGAVGGLSLPFLLSNEAFSTVIGAPHNISGDTDKSAVKRIENRILLLIVIFSSS